MKQLYHWLCGFFKPKRSTGPQAVEGKLSADAKLQLAREVAFLKGQHGVEVRELEAGEVATKPRPADPSVEEKLPAIAPEPPQGP